jgi:hypothetical protein
VAEVAKAIRQINEATQSATKSAEDCTTASTMLGTKSSYLKDAAHGLSVAVAGDIAQNAA